jgi:repressor LexA
MSSPLTARQNDVLSFIQRYVQRENRPPTMKEIGGGVGVASTSAVSKVLHALEQKGYLERTPNVSRGLRLLGSPLSSSVASAASLPVITHAFDRNPADLHKTLDGTIQVDTSLLAGTPLDETIVVTLEDDGMSSEGIRKGDQVVTHVLAATHLREADLAIAVLREQLVARMIEYTGGLWHVKPLTRRYSAETFKHGDKDFFPLGRALGLIRSLR